MHSWKLVAASLGLISAIALAVTAIPALAQYDASTMPDTAGYGPDNGASQPDMSGQAPDADPGGDGSSVIVPIPGGGDVSADGPAVEPQDNPPPTETWSSQQQAPNSVGGAPTGP